MLIFFSTKPFLPDDAIMLKLVESHQKVDYMKVIFPFYS